MAKRSAKPVQASEPHQVGALPLRWRDYRPEVCLVTTRETRRWSIPKGWPMKRVDDSSAAAIEAEQEAGLFGRISKSPVGSFQYLKRLPDRAETVRIDVYRLDVDGQHDSWPEKDERSVQWFRLDEAERLVEEPGLVAIFEEVRQAATLRFV
jgi:8-oxo-dGTP pyrophosphatase MutT (NUDIX family)